MRRWSVPAAAGAVLVAGLAALTLTPEPALTPAAGLAGWPRLGMYALAGVLLAVTACEAAGRHTIVARPWISHWRGSVLVGLGVTASLVVALVNALRLRSDFADPLGPVFWVASMALLLGYLLFPQVQRIGWLPLWPVWPENSPLSYRRWLPWAILGLLLVIAAATRLPALGTIPQGVNPDEGDRASTALDVLNGVAPASWFDSGWYFINMVYFRVLAVSLAVFGRDVQGGRTLSALCGIAFVAVIAWFGCRNFGWRTGLLATAFATGMQMTIQHSRLITEAGPTALLWAVSIGGFLEGARSGRLWAWALAGTAGGLGLYFYPSARLWAVGAALTVLVMLGYLRSWRLLPGIGLAAVASIIATLPFLFHLTMHPDEISGRYAQTAVLDPANQSRLPYLRPPEPLPELAALQLERTLGMFDRYPDGGGFLPIGHPLFGPPLAQLALVGAVYLTVRGFWRDVRLAILAVWFWVGLSGVALTVETPDYLRAVGILPSLCFVMAVPLVDLLDRVVPLLASSRRQVVAVALPAVAAVVLLTPEIVGYFATLRTMPGGWGPETREGLVIGQLGSIGPVYSLEMNEHMVTSGWVRLLAQNTERGRMPNPGRELPVLASVGSAAERPEFVPSNGQGFSVIMSPDSNQRPYVPLLQGLYPGALTGDGGDERVLVRVPPQGLAAADGVTLVDGSGASFAVARFGELPPDVPLPEDLTWRAGVRLPVSGTYVFTVNARSNAQLRVDGMGVIDGDGPSSQTIQAAPGVHFVELHASVTSANSSVSLAIGPTNGAVSELSPQQTYRLMDAPWGLLARLAQPTSAGSGLTLDATVAMAFFGPELGFIAVPNAIEWTGTLLAPRSGTYRMAFASEDTMLLQLDGQPVDVVTVKPEGWETVGTGSQVMLAAGPHRVQVTLKISHGGRDLARWNWVPPTPRGALDPTTPWSVVPPQVLRPDPAISVVR